MDMINIGLVALLCAMTAFIANLSASVFHDGIRPILPQLVEGNMTRRDAGSVAFGLSIGFVASVGISFTLSTGLLNPWLLFLPTDILGVMIASRWLAALAGGLWGILVVTSLSGVNAVLTGLPIDALGALGELGTPVMTAFALFPLLAIFYQFGWKAGAVAAAVVLLSRLLTIQFTSIYPESIQIFVGMLMLIGTAIQKDMADKRNGITPPDMSGMHSLFDERTKRIMKHLPLLAATGALVSIVANAGIFAGSEVSIYALADVYKMTDPIEKQAAMQQVALSEFMRGIGFVPLIATTALATGVYGVVGMTFVFVVGYLSPNIPVAAVLGALTICVEIFVLRKIGHFLERFPSIRNASDNIRNSMNTLMEFSLLIGGVLAVMKMGSTTGLTIFTMLFFLNEVMGRPILKIAAPAVAAILTGVVLNVLYVFGLFAV
ncbi:YhfT family protein [Photobacterium sp. ZSDE20]|uniref:YhfT family protein n=1 Tax=Photobacterium pectinilyticum TaxID=2906793 RepID=A0ABT1MW84_9GAMM|nr:YhfT family protein [Photobacterium sp. ZSDE20]MCQ1056629.1 YhfT family protein [Photobacterium sp. ZSDE20]MDD1820764.1 YhfT family protein [Photobacterium sp. ZSDE20]